MSNANTNNKSNVRRNQGNQGQTANIQDRLYSVLKEERVKAKVYLTNGFQMDGIIKDYDNYSVLLMKDGHEKLIYKSAISTIEPLKSVNLLNGKVNSNQVNIQDRLYSALKEKQVKTKVYLTNGFPMEGTIKDFDNFTILLVKDGAELLIYKSAISTIEPTKAVFY